MKKILVICNENVGRSPLLTAILMQRLHKQGIQVDSAGIIKTDILGASPLTLKMIAAMKKTKPTPELSAIEAQLQKHKPKQVTVQLLQEADLILTMSPQQSAVLTKQFQSQIPNLKSKMASIREFASQKRLQGKPGKMRDTKGKPIGTKRYQNWSESIRVANRLIQHIR